MEQETPTNKALALFLFSGEWAGDSTSDELQSAAQRTFKKLNAHLAKRLGSEGYYHLLKRAVVLATTDFPWLASVTVTEKGLLEGFELVSGVQTVSEIADGAVAVLASLIELLEIFIGGKLCLRVLRNVWPDRIMTGMNDLQGESNGQ